MLKTLSNQNLVGWETNVPFLHKNRLYQRQGIGWRFSSATLRMANDTVRWQDKVCTSSMREKTGQCPLSIILQKRHLTWYKHLTRMKAEKLPKQAMNWKLPGKRGCSRPRTTLRQTISSDLSIQQPRHVIRGGRSCSTGPDQMEEANVRLMHHSALEDISKYK